MSPLPICPMTKDPEPPDELDVLQSGRSALIHHGSSGLSLFMKSEMNFLTFSTRTPVTLTPPVRNWYTSSKDQQNRTDRHAQQHERPVGGEPRGRCCEARSDRRAPSRR